MSLGSTLEIRGPAFMEVSDSGGGHLGSLGAMGPFGGVGLGTVWQFTFQPRLAARPPRHAST